MRIVVLVTKPVSPYHALSSTIQHFLNLDFIKHLAVLNRMLISYEAK